MQDSKQLSKRSDSYTVSREETCENEREKCGASDRFPTLMPKASLNRTPESPHTETHHSFTFPVKETYHTEKSNCSEAKKRKQAGCAIKRLL